MPGTRRGTAHLLVPGSRPRGVHGLRAGVAQTRAAQSQQRQRPAPGRAGPEPCPLPHSARDGRAPPAGSGALRVEAGAARLRADGARPEKAGEAQALRDAPTRTPRPPPPASRSHFSFSTPCARASPRSLNDAQVPPGAALFISLPSPKCDSPSTTTPCLRCPCLSAGGLG